MQTSKGFSLVELAIVLVIIGLITGGILTGQDLIRASELNSVVADTNKIRTSINTFKLKYNAMPGDMTNGYSYFNVVGGAACTNAVPTNAATNGCNGDGDGQIDIAAPATIYESLNVFFHLSLSGIYPGSYTKTANTALYVPASRVASGYFWFAYSGGNFSFTGGANVIQIGGLSGEFWEVLFTPAEAQSIDAKMDDGVAASGNTRTINGYSGGWVTTCLTSGAYNLAGTAVACVMGTKY